MRTTFFEMSARIGFDVQDLKTAVEGGKGQGQGHPSPNLMHAADRFFFCCTGVCNHVVATTVCTTECVHTLRVARTVPLVALHPLRAHWLRHTSRCGHTTFGFKV